MALMCQEMILRVVVVEVEEEGAEAAEDVEAVDEGVIVHHATRVERSKMERRLMETRPRPMAAVACRWAACFSSGSCF